MALRFSNGLGWPRSSWHPNELAAQLWAQMTPHMFLLFVRDTGGQLCCLPFVWARLLDTVNSEQHPKPMNENSHSIPSTTPYWPKQIPRSAQNQKLRKEIPTLEDRSCRITEVWFCATPPWMRGEEWLPPAICANHFTLVPKPGQIEGWAPLWQEIATTTEKPVKCVENHIYSEFSGEVENVKIRKSGEEFWFGMHQGSHKGEWKGRKKGEGGSGRMEKG